MSTTHFIRRFIFSLPTNKLFSTRDVLIYGTRSSVDQALCRLVKSGILIRLARGIFTRESDHLHNFSHFDIAQFKAQAFHKQITAPGINFAYELGLISKPDNNDHKLVFYINGSSSKFKTGKVTILFSLV